MPFRRNVLSKFSKFILISKGGQKLWDQWGKLAELFHPYTSMSINIFSPLIIIPGPPLHRNCIQPVLCHRELHHLALLFLFLPIMSWYPTPQVLEGSIRVIKLVDVDTYKTIFTKIAWGQLKLISASH